MQLEQLFDRVEDAPQTVRFGRSGGDFNPARRNKIKVEFWPHPFEYLRELQCGRLCARLRLQDLLDQDSQYRRVVT